jgi:quercetin dioxygenase-like cupin family protein
MIARWLGVSVVGLFLVVGAASGAGQEAAASPHGGASGSKAAVMLTPGEVKWSPAPKSLPPGAQAAVLEGDPSKKGVFSMRLKVPSGYTIPAHTHPRQERITVLSGKFQLGHGGKFDEAKLQDLEPGSYFSLPPGMQHFARASEDTVIQLNSDGPWEIKYVNPADDPRHTSSAGAGKAGAATSGTGTGQ